MHLHLPNLKSLTVAVIGTLACLGSLPAMAQSSSTNDPLQDFQLEDTNDPDQIFTDRAGPGSLFDLLNRLQQVNGRSGSEFAEDQSKDFNSAVDSFRKKQQEQLSNPSQSSPGSINTPESTP